MKHFVSRATHHARVEAPATPHIFCWCRRYRSGRMNVCKRHARRQANSHLEQIVIVGIADEVEEVDWLVEVPDASIWLK
jgi:hypothetical protein